MKSDLQPDLPELCGKFGLSDKVRQHLELFVNLLRQAEEVGRNFVLLPRVLLSGNATVDRMQIAAAVASASARPLVAAHARDLKSAVDGESSERIRKLFERAYAQEPCLLFIDEIDLIATRRGSPNDDDRSTEIVRELGEQIMSLHSGRRLLLMAYANDPENLDSSIRLKFGTRIDLWRLWQGLVLRPSVKDKLAGVLQSIESGSAAFNTLIFGPPGTGKTEIIRQLVKGSGVRFVAAGAVDFRAGFIGQSAMRVRGVFEKVRGNTPAILFIDLEGPLLPPRNSHLSDSFSEELLVEVLTQMDSLHGQHPPVFIIGETFHTDRVDPAVVSRFDIRIEIPLPSESERCEILEQMIRTSAVSGDSLDVNEVSAHLARSLPGASGRDINNVVRTAIQHARKRSADQDFAQLTHEDLLAAAQESRVRYGP